MMVDQSKNEKGKISNSDKIMVLLKLVEENGKQTEWLKNLDYKIVYYSVLFLLVVIGTVLTEKILLPMWFFYLTTGCIAVLAIAFFIRNHVRHDKLKGQFEDLAEALELTECGTYAKKAIYKKREGHDWAFHLGRGLYSLIVVISVILALLLLYNMSQNSGQNTGKLQPPNQIHSTPNPRG